jgi:cell division septation protein DedD
MKSKKNKKGTKKYHLEFSGSSVFFWTFALFFLMGWIFVLGIFVGRGYLNERLENISELKSSIAKLQRVVRDKESAKENSERERMQEPKFAFYKELTEEKEKNLGQNRPSDVKNKKVPQKSSEKENRGDKSDSEKRISPSLKPAVKAPDTDVKAGSFSVQVASLGNSGHAQKLIERLKGTGYPAFINKVAIGGKTYYRVHCGPFGTRQEALSFKKNLAAKEKMDGIVSRHDIQMEPTGRGQKPLPKPAKKVEEASKGGGFTVQIASLNTEKEAQRLVNRLKKNGFPAYFYKTKVKGRTRFRVRCGSFNDRKSAEAFRKKLAKKEHIVGFITGIEK